MPAWRRWIAVAIALYLLLVLLDRFALVEHFFRRAGVALGAAIFETFALIGCGHAVQRVIPSAARNLLLRRAAGASSPSTRLGMTPWGHLDPMRDLLVGYPLFGTLCFLIGLLNVSAPLMLALLVAGGVWGIYAVVRRFESRPMKLASVPVIPLAIAAIGFVIAQAPPSSPDELASALAVPWAWVKEGRAIALPLLSHSYSPLGIESADLPLLALFGALGGGIASHFLHLGAAIAAAFVVWEMTERNALATAAIVTAPALAIAAGWSLAAWPLAGLTLVAFEAFARDDDARFSAALGAGLLTKYTFLPIAIVLVVTSRRWRAGAIAIAVGCAFFVRNAILLAAVAPHIRGGTYLSDLVVNAKLPAESLGASLPALLPLTAGLVPVILGVVAVALFFVGPPVRVLLPFLVVPGVVAARNLVKSRTVRVLLAVAVAVQLFVVIDFVDRSGVLALLGARQRDEEYLVKARPSYVTIENMDALLPPGAVALVVGVNETYWFEHRVRGGGNADGPRVSAYLDEGTPDALYAKLKRDGITHVAVASLPPEGDTALSPPAQRMLAQTLDHYAAGVASRGAATVFTLR